MEILHFTSISYEIILQISILDAGVELANRRNYY